MAAPTPARPRSRKNARSNDITRYHEPAMERPRLRPLEAFPLAKNGQKLLALRDPSRLTDSVATLPPVAVAIIQLFDGETTRVEICAEFQRRYGTPLQPEALDRL